MTIDELIERLESAKEDLGGDAEVMIATQPSWPLANKITAITVGDPETQGEDAKVLWIGTDQAREPGPYAPGWAWDGTVF